VQGHFGVKDALAMEVPSRLTAVGLAALAGLATLWVARRRAAQLRRFADVELVGDVRVKVIRPTGGSAASNGLVLIQEWWGWTEELEAQARFLADAVHCKVAIPDLYDGKSTLDAEEAHHLMSNLNWGGAVGRLGSVCAFLKQREGCGKVAIAGFCMGGALSVAGAVNCVDAAGKPAFCCAVPFYGTPPAQLADASNCRVPVQGHFGLKDAMAGFSDPAAASSLEAALAKAGVAHEVHRYAGVGHAFMNASPQSVALKTKLGQIGPKPDDAKHDPAAINLAWGRMIAFLRKHGI
jgi:carboxymethylenebutenolidase